MLELWEMWSTSSLPSLPGLLCPRVVALDRVLSMGQIELNCVLMQNWIVWNRTVFTFNCVQTKMVFMLNWIVWNRTVYIYMYKYRTLAERLECSPLARETWIHSQIETYQRLKKWYLMPPCLTQHYKVQIKSKVERSTERSSALPYTLV